MELTVALAISIISIIITVLNFAIARKERAIEETKEMDEETSNQKLIDYRLTQVEKKLDKILNMLDKYDVEIEAHIEKAMAQHIKLYHKEVK